MKNHFKSSIITSVFLLLLGGLLIFESEATISIISYVIGAILVAAGTLAFLRYIKTNQKGFDVSELDILYGIVTIIIGVLVIKNPQVIASIIPVILGIAIIVSSATKTQYALELKDNDNDLWKTTLAIAIISALCGIVLLFNPFAGAVLIMRIVGIFICVYAVLDIVSTLIIKKNVDEYNDMVDTTTIELNKEAIEEASVVEEPKVTLEENNDPIVEEKKETPVVKKTTTKKTTAPKKTATKPAVKKSTTTKKATTKPAAKKTTTKKSTSTAKKSTTAKKTTTRAKKTDTK